MYKHDKAYLQEETKKNRDAMENNIEIALVELTEKKISESILACNNSIEVEITMNSLVRSILRTMGKRKEGADDENSLFINIRAVLYDNISWLREIVEKVINKYYGNILLEPFNCHKMYDRPLFSFTLSWKPENN